MSVVFSQAMLKQIQFAIEQKGIVKPNRVHVSDAADHPFGLSFAPNGHFCAQPASIP
jgi:hypothetical protein